MTKCNPNPGTGSQEGSESEDPEGSSDEKEVSEHAEYDGQVPEDDVVDEDPLEEGEVEGTPSAARSGPPEDNLDFDPVDDTLGDPEVEELVLKKPKKSKKNKEVPNEEVDVSEALTKKQNTGGKRKGKKVATTSAKNDDIESMPTEVVPSTPPNIVLVLGDGEAPYPWQRRVQVLRDRRKRRERRGSQKPRSYIQAMMGCRMFKPKFLLRDPLECQNRR
jgi:hypothetical protein